MKLVILSTVLAILLGCNIDKAENQANDWAQDNIGINIQHIECAPLWFETAHCEVFTPTQTPYILRCDPDACRWIDGGKAAY